LVEHLCAGVQDWFAAPKAIKGNMADEIHDPAAEGYEEYLLSSHDLQRKWVNPEKCVDVEPRSVIRDIDSSVALKARQMF